MRQLSHCGEYIVNILLGYSPLRLRRVELVHAVVSHKHVVLEYNLGLVGMGRLH